MRERLPSLPSIDQILNLVWDSDCKKCNKFGSWQVRNTQPTMMVTVPIRGCVMDDIINISNIISDSCSNAAESVTEPDIEPGHDIQGGQQLVDELCENLDWTVQNQLGLPENRYWNAHPQDSTYGGEALDKRGESRFG
jgi:hypothetical protein